MKNEVVLEVLRDQKVWKVAVTEMYDTCMFGDCKEDWAMTYDEAVERMDKIKVHDEDKRLIVEWNLVEGVIGND